MIDEALKIIKSQLQQFMRLKMQIENVEEKVVLTSIVDQRGQSTIPIDSVGITLYRIEEDQVSEAEQYSPDHQTIRTRPPVKLNLYILFAANFKDYSESLKYIRAVLTFFQTKSYFDTTNTPDMPLGMEPMSLVLHTQSVDQHNHIWGLFGGHYMPSVIYRLRSIYIQEDQVIDVDALVEEMDIIVEEKPFSPKYAR